MTTMDISFLLAAAMTLSSALAVVLFKNVLHSAVALFFCFLGISVLYLLLSADFMAVAQVLIYAGGVLVLIIFGVFFTANMYKKEAEFSIRKKVWIPGAAIFLIMVMGLSLFIRDFPLAKQLPEATSSIEGIGHLLLGKYLLPFELISILLLFVMVGAARIMKKELTEHDRV